MWPPIVVAAVTLIAIALRRMGFLVEVAEGATGIHDCRMSDLIPDMAGAYSAAVMIIAARYVGGLRSAVRT